MTFFGPPTPEGWVPRENGEVEEPGEWKVQSLAEEVAQLISKWEHTNRFEFNDDSLLGKIKEAVQKGMKKPESMYQFDTGGYCVPHELDPTKEIPESLQGGWGSSGDAEDEDLGLKVRYVDEDHEFVTEKINEWFTDPTGRPRTEFNHPYKRFVTTGGVTMGNLDPNDPHVQTIHINLQPKPDPADRSKLLNEANTLINGDRARDYGDASINFRRIADYWNRWLGEQYDPDSPGPVNIQPSDVAMMMLFVKVARESQGNKWDSVADLLGYGALYGELKKAEEEWWATQNMDGKENSSS